MADENTKSLNGYADAARLEISPSTYEAMIEFFAEKALPKMIQNLTKEKEISGETVCENCDDKGDSLQNI